MERNGFKLQKRIYQASQRGDIKTVRQLQRLLLNSQSAKLLAVRKVSQDNQGKKTAGVDGVKSPTPNQRLALAKTLTIGQKAQPVRRVWIPKAGTDEQRPLGIPTIANRAGQALVILDTATNCVFLSTKGHEETQRLKRKLVYFVFLVDS